MNRRNFVKRAGLAAILSNIAGTIKGTHEPVKDERLIVMRSEKLFKEEGLPCEIGFNNPFIECSYFNQDISNWNLDSVTDLSNMF